MACPVVPAGMSFLATTAVVVAEDPVEPLPPCFDAPCTLAYAIALPAMNRITPTNTKMPVCFFTDSPSSQQADSVRGPDGLLAPLVPQEGTTGSDRRI